jgi:RHS repeat-associated protein
VVGKAVLHLDWYWLPCGCCCKLESVEIARFPGSTTSGQEHDGETTPNLDFFQARYYSGEQGRFLSPDPLNAGADPLNPQSWNGYGYAWSNSLTNIDPSGADVC